MAQIQEQGQPFTIKVLDGPRAGQIIQEGQPKGQINLVGRALPYRPIVYEGTQRIRTTWYPGNPVATQQVMGPTEIPTTINGWWKDVFLGDGQARNLMELFDDLRRIGSLVQVEWGIQFTDANLAAGTHIVRRGIIHRTRFTLDRPQDIVWEIEFEWQGRDDVPVNPVFATDVLTIRDNVSDVGQAFSDASDSVSDYVNAFSSRLFGFSQGVIDKVDENLDVLNDAVSAFFNADMAIRSVDQLPNNVLERLSGFVDNTLVVAKDLIDLFSDPVHLLPHDDALTVLQQQAAMLNVFSALDASNESAIRFKQTAQSNLQPDILAEVRVPGGVDLRDIAFRFYGDPDAWWLIANKNNLSSSKVPAVPSGPSDDPGLPLLIPRLQAGRAGDIGGVVR